MVLSELSDEHRAQLAVDSARRGVMAAGIQGRKIRRSAGESLALDEFCMWLNRHAFDVFFSVTYRDDYATSHGIRSVGSAARDVRAGLSDFGFKGRFGLGAEMTDREIPHVHGVLSSAGDTLQRLLGDTPREGALFRHFFATRGRCRFELMRDQDEATLYALKDTFKNSKEPDALLLRMRPSGGLRNARVHLSEQEQVFATRTAKRRRLASVVE
jgi:hypothetical protein